MTVLKPANEGDQIGVEEGPYRDNPLLQELEDTKKQLAHQLQTTEYWHNEYTSTVNLYNERLKEHQSKEYMKSFIKFFLWVVFIPTWFVLTIACLYVPFYAFFVRNGTPYWFWTVPLGLASGGLLLLYIHASLE